MFTLDRLPSGLRVLTAPSAGTAAVTVMVFAGAGSRYEERKERGISHFLEHMFFKGGKKYRTTKEVSAAIDGVGGDFNAFTGKEYAGYYVKMASKDVELACDVLSDMLIHAAFPPEEIEKERGVIIEEERMYQDTPMYRAGWDFEELLFGDHPLGWDTIGSEELIRTVTQADFQKHKDDLYSAENLVITFAGNITVERAKELAKQYFGAIKGKHARKFLPFDTYGPERIFLRTKNTEQAHLVLGVPGPGSQDKDHFAHKLLAIILGGNMSSRMFLNIREAKGLCYYIATETDNYLDAGSLSTRAGVDQSRLHEAITAICREYAECAKHGVTDEEVHRAKEYLKGKVMLSLEDSEERAHFFGKQELLYPKTRSIEEYLARVEEVGKEAIDALARRILRPDALRLVVIGKEEKKDALAGLLT
jgi:predicted Zn-dependent peptidase